MRYLIFLLLIGCSLNATEYLPNYQKKSKITNHFTAAGKEIPALIKKLFVRVSENSEHDPNKPAVLLVHGLNASPADWYFVAKDLRAKGFEVYTVSLAYYWPRNGYKKSVNKIYAKIQEILQTHPDLAVVGHSLGGVSALDAVNHLREEKTRIRQLITVNSPLNGTAMLNCITKSVMPRHLSEVLEYNGAFVQKLREEGVKSQEAGVKMYHTATESDHLVIGLDTCFLPNFEGGIVITGAGHLSTLNEPIIRSKLLEWLTSPNTSTSP